MGGERELGHGVPNRPRIQPRHRDDPRRKRPGRPHVRRGRRLGREPRRPHAVQYRPRLRKGVAHGRRRSRADRRGDRPRTRVGHELGRKGDPRRLRLGDGRRSDRRRPRPRRSRVRLRVRVGGEHARRHGLACRPGLLRRDRDHRDRPRSLGDCGRARLRVGLERVGGRSDPYRPRDEPGVRLPRDRRQPRRDRGLHPMGSSSRSAPGAAPIAAAPSRMSSPTATSARSIRRAALRHFSSSV
ncbi:hypothetical protein BH09ACT13_BH09ACT13_04630 [soil metagenome]